MYIFVCRGKIPPPWLKCYQDLNYLIWRKREQKMRGQDNLDKINDKDIALAARIRKMSKIEGKN